MSAMSINYIYYSYLLYGVYKHAYLLEYAYNTASVVKKVYRYVTKPKINHENVEKDKGWILCEEPDPMDDAEHVETDGLP